MLRARSPLALLTATLLALTACPSTRTAATAHPSPSGSPSPPASTSTSTPATASSSDVAVLPPYEVQETRRKHSSDGDLCEPADDNIDRAARAILGEAPASTPAPRATWDHATPPERLDLVADRFALTSAERAMLVHQGFVVPERLSLGTYTRAFHEIYQSELPIYVSADSVLHAVYKSNDAILAGVEQRDLVGREERVLGAMHGSLKAAATSYPPEVARDLDVYLTVARTLLADASVPSQLGTDTQASDLVARAREASGMHEVDLFGRVRVIDFSQYAPRGHYASFQEGALKPYFRASMWLSRLEFNLVSRSCMSSKPSFIPDPTETPREDLDALALADLAQRAGALDDIAVMDRAWSVLAGRREDVSVADLLRLRAKASIRALTDSDAAARLRAAIGNDFERTTRIHYMPQYSTRLPAIATMLGPRIVPDATAMTVLVHSAVPDRYLVGAGDVAYVLGEDHAKDYLKADLAKFPTLGTQLDVARKRVSDAPAGEDLYSAWLGGVRALAEKPKGVVPSFMEAPAFLDLRMNSTIAAYAQLKHNYVLITGQAYDEGGCEVPDGFVEPAPGVYEALGAYADRGAAAMHALGDGDTEEYFHRLGFHLRVLRALALDELENRPLSEEAKRYLSMVVEITPPSSDGPGSNDGWYFSLFQDTEQAFGDAGFVADYFTSSNASKVVYAGATEPRVGIFVVDTAGPPRVVVGPVARAFELQTSLEHRLNDAEAAKLPRVSDPWAKSYTVPGRPMPPLALRGVDSDGTSPTTFRLRSSTNVGKVTIELLDHHRKVIARASAFVGPGETRLRVPIPKAVEEAYFSSFRVRAGEASAEVDTLYSFGSYIEAHFGGAPPIPAPTDS